MAKLILNHSKFSPTNHPNALYIFNSCLLIINHVSKEKILCKIEQMINKNVFKKTSKKQIMIHTKNANIIKLLCICDIN